MASWMFKSCENININAMPCYSAWELPALARGYCTGPMRLAWVSSNPAAADESGPVAARAPRKDI
ncbi:hypothetical protein IW146_005355, partial [Coemansia sp. RSA 922]